MKKGKEPMIYVSDDDSSTDHSEEEVEPKEKVMSDAFKLAPKEKVVSDASKLAQSKAAKRRQANLDSAKRSRERKAEYITSLEKERENLTYFNSTETTNINRELFKREGLLIERDVLTTRLHSINQGYVQSLEEYRRLDQERIPLENLQQEQSRAANDAQEPQQIQPSGPFHQQAHQLGGPHNAAHYSYGTMVPQQIQTSGPSHQQEGAVAPEDPDQRGGARYIMRQEAATWEGAHATPDQQVDAAGWLGNDAAGGDVPGPGQE